MRDRLAVLRSAPFFGFSLFDLGPALFGFFCALLIFGWSIGLTVISIIFRQGEGAEELAWAVIFMLAPICCVYYPIETLPAAIQPIALALPPTHVFEGMRAILVEQRFDAGALLAALGLGTVYLAFAIAFFLRTCAFARENVLALQQGD